jgi:thiol:disulfide interchange protein DsbD
MYRKLSLFLIAVLAVSVGAFAEIVKPVTWTSDVQNSNDGGAITFSAKIESGYHIYGFKQVKDGPIATSITFSENPDVTLVGAIEPSTEAHSVIDKTFNLNLEEWSKDVTFTQHFKLKPGATGAKVTATIKYMACSGTSCTPPETLTFDLSLGNGVQQTAGEDSVVEDQAAAPAGPHVEAAEQSDIWAPVETDGTAAQTAAANESLWSLLLMGFLGGLLALLTPCVWPMIPMTVSFFLKKNKDRKKSIIQAVTYGVSIIIIYLVMGLAITIAFGAGELNDIATSAVFNLIFFALLVIFAISFFGAFDIKLPSKWSNSLDNKAENTTGLLSIFFMAFTLVLVSFSCTGPIIGTLLVEAATQGSILGPALGMGGFAFGLALPFTLFAFFPSLLKEMPRSGGWMNSVKVVLGFIELILSLKFLSVADLAYGWRILDREVFISIWIVLFVLLGLYLLGKLRFPHDAEKKSTSVGGFFMAVASFAFAVYLLPGLWGAPLKVTSAFAPPLRTQDFNLYGGQFKEFTDYEEGMAYAKENNMPVMVDFSGHACVNCRKMEGSVFDTPAVRDLMEKEYVLIKLMVDEKEDLAKPYVIEDNGTTFHINTVGDKWKYLQQHKFNINSQPYYVLLDNDGKPLGPSREYDEDVNAFVEWLNNGIEQYKSTK